METVLRMANAHYSCTGCGDCCRGWKVPLLAGEAERFRELAAPLVPAEQLTRVLHSMPTKKDAPALEVLNARQGCVVLADDQLCRIHATYGSEAKPAVCRLFPLTFVQTPSEVRVGLSFFCPAVLDGVGPHLSEQRTAIESLFSGSIAGTRYTHQVGEMVALTPRRTLPWAEAALLIEEMVTQLRARGTLVEKICRAELIVALLEDELEQGRPFAAALVAARAEHAAMVTGMLAAPPSTNLASRSLFRSLCKTFEHEASPNTRLWATIVAAAGAGKVRLRDGAVACAAVERVATELPEDAEALLTRWITLSVESLLFFGATAFNLSLVGGFQLLTMSAAVAAYTARANAALHGRSKVSLEDAKAGVRQVDHRLHHSGHWASNRLERVLLATSSLDVLRTQIESVRAKAA